MYFVSSCDAFLVTKVDVCFWVFHFLKVENFVGFEVLSFLALVGEFSCG